MNVEYIKQELNLLKGKTVAIVYIFEGDDSSGFEHFFIWKSNIISLWLNAVQDIKCRPFIIDVRTFVDKAINNTLPHIDFVINLNSGTLDLSTMALVPSICSSINVPCIPCDATTITAGENKKLSNLIANSLGLNVPKNIDNKNTNGIFRPINLGNSLGVKRSYNNTTKGIYQEFIEGYDITTPIVYNVTERKMDLLPTIIYIPESCNTNWYNGDEAKKTRSGYSFKIVEPDITIKSKYLELIDTLSINTFCRIDARVKSDSIDEDIDSIDFDDTYFIEVNVMPTIREYNNFVHSYNAISPDSTYQKYFEAYKQVFEKTPNLNCFLLSSSMIALKPSTK